MADKIYPTYESIHNEVISYADLIKEHNIKYDCIIALARGGTLIGTIISHALNVPMIVAQYSSIEGQGETKHAANHKLPDLNHHHILIVDDICDTGHTFNEITKHYEKKGHIVNTYAVHFRHTAKHIHYPNFSIELLGDEWVVYPWEQSNTLGGVDGFIDDDETWPETKSYT